MREMLGRELNPSDQQYPHNHVLDLHIILWGGSTLPPVPKLLGIFFTRERERSQLPQWSSHIYDYKYRNLKKQIQIFYIFKQKDEKSADLAMAGRAVMWRSAVVDTGYNLTNRPVQAKAPPPAGHPRGNAN